MNLRPYQVHSVNDISCKKRNLIHLATGAGKSVIFKELVKHELKKNKKVLFLVAGTSILDQAVKKHFGELTDSIGYMQGSRRFEKKDILCASIDTLSRRTKIHKEIIDFYDYFIIDEAHHCTAKRYLNFLDEIKDKTVVGLTATPYKVGKKGHTYWDKVIHPISVLNLIKQKYLVFPKCFVASCQMDTDVKTTAGDYNQKELFEKNDKPAIYGSIVSEYQKKYIGKKAICFSINVKHSITICEAFNNIGVRAVHADAKTPQDERNAILKEFEHGNIDVLCNVNIFSTGIDVPIAEVGIMARPTKSRILWVQQVGRLLRPFKNKKFAYIIDHGNNIKNIGHPLNDFPAELEDGPQKDDDEFKTTQCPKCFYTYSEKTKTCPECGATNDAKERLDALKIEAEMVEVRLEKERLKKDEKSIEWADYLKYRCSDEFLFYFKKYTTTNIKKYLPDLIECNHGCLKDESFNEDLRNSIETAYRRGHKKVSIMFKYKDLLEQHGLGIKDRSFIKMPEWILNEGH